VTATSSSKTWTRTGRADDLLLQKAADCYHSAVMKVLIAGSGRHLLPTATPPAVGPLNDAVAQPAYDATKVDELLGPLRKAARELGVALREGGHEIWIGSDDPLDVDPFVVEGALTQDPSVKVNIRVPRAFQEPYAGKPSVYKEWGEFPDWDVTSMEVIDKVEAVILLGGRLGVVHAGTAAWMMRKVVVPVGSFGGGAEKVGRYGSSRRANFYHGALSDQEIDRLASPWGAGVDAKAVIGSLQKVYTSSLEKRVDMSLLRTTSVLMIVALACWVAGLVSPSLAPSISGRKAWPSEWNFALLFPTVIAAGTLGACVKTLRAIRLGAMSNLSANVDTVLGIAAGMMAAVLYLLAQIGVTGKIDLALTHEAYTRVSIIVSMAALFAGLYLDKAFAYFDGVGTSVIKGQHGKKDSPP
jgi:hypothetical protein